MYTENQRITLISTIHVRRGVKSHVYSYGKEKPQNRTQLPLLGSQKSRYTQEFSEVREIKADK